MPTLVHYALAFCSAHPTLKPNERLVLLALASVCDQAGVHRMRQCDIAHLTGISARGIVRAVQALKDYGLLNGSLHLDVELLKEIKPSPLMMSHIQRATVTPRSDILARQSVILAPAAKEQESVLPHTPSYKEKENNSSLRSECACACDVLRDENSFKEFYRNYPASKREMEFVLRAKWAEAEKKVFDPSDIVKALMYARHTPDWIDSNYRYAPRASDFLDKCAFYNFLSSDYQERIAARDKRIEQESKREEFSYPPNLPDTEEAREQYRAYVKSMEATYCTYVS